MPPSSPVAIVTGAASGIGLALTKHLLSLNWRVAMGDISPRGSSLAASLGPNVLFVRTDVSSWLDLSALFRNAWDAWGRMDFYAANAGIGDTDSLSGPASANHDEVEPREPNLKTLDVNLNAAIYGVRLSAHYFRKNQKKSGGKIVFTSSAAGIYPTPDIPIYCASKHALIGLTRSLAGPFSRENITVNAILPAFVPTGLAPEGLIDAWPREHVTPMSTVMKAYDMFLDDEKRLTGQTGECSLDQVFLRQKLEYPNESQRWCHEESASLWANAYPDNTHKGTV
ncbi:hypothetical protein RUND412_007006 [Rhizina undulata]